MPIARVQLVRSTGSYVVGVALTYPQDATWSFEPAQYPGPAGDLGPPLAFEAWRQSYQSAKFRRLEIDSKTVYIETDYGEYASYELWLGINSSQPVVQLTINKALRAYDSLGDFVINSGVTTASCPKSLPTPAVLPLQLWNLPGPEEEQIKKETRLPSADQERKTELIRKEFEDRVLVSRIADPKNSIGDAR